jgi:hypothetical protein
MKNDVKYRFSASDWVVIGALFIIAGWIAAATWNFWRPQPQPVPTQTTSAR